MEFSLLYRSSLISEETELHVEMISDTVSLIHSTLIGVLLWDFLMWPSLNFSRPCYLSVCMTYFSWEDEARHNCRLDIPLMGI